MFSSNFPENWFFQKKYEIILEIFSVPVLWDWYYFHQGLTRIFTFTTIYHNKQQHHGD